jgi:hypothetical protein
MRKLVFVLMTSTLVLAACKKKGGTSVILEKVQLISPTQNEICSTGTVVNDEQTKITFNWSAPVFAESFTLVLKNLLSNTEESTQIMGTSAVFTLARNTPYSWYIIAKSSKTTQSSTSDTWRFYVSGSGITNYAPFPAELTSPKYGDDVVGNTLSLTWKGNDPDNDIISYDIYLNYGSSPFLTYSNVKNQFVNNITINVKGNFTWRVVTKDAAGNTSTSETFIFKMK